MAEKKRRTKERVWSDTDILTAAKLRMKQAYDKYDEIKVSFSGGKDSTACLQLAIAEATERDRLPVKAVFYDEECIPPETVDYVERVARRDDVDLEWLCIPIKCRNACSRKQPHWYPWAPEDRDKWVRPLPELATHYDLPKRVSHADHSTEVVTGTRNTIGLVMGIRAAESMTRFRAICSATGERAWQKPVAPGYDKVYPIYDWSNHDMWVVPELEGWDYNRAYDVLTAQGIGVNRSRCSPPFGEQPIRQLHVYKTCWPELWGKMTRRVHGARTAARYANTTLYGYGSDDEIEDYRKLTMELAAKLPDEDRREVVKGVETCLRDHRAYTDDAIPMEEPHPRSGHSWKIISKMAVIGGDKFGRQSQKAMKFAMEFRRKNGVG